MPGEMVKTQGELLFEVLLCCTLLVFQTTIDRVQPPRFLFARIRFPGFAGEPALVWQSCPPRPTVQNAFVRTYTASSPWGESVPFFTCIREWPSTAMPMFSGAGGRSTVTYLLWKVKSSRHRLPGIPRRHLYACYS